MEHVFGVITCTIEQSACYCSPKDTDQKIKYKMIGDQNGYVDWWFIAYLHLHPCNLMLSRNFARTRRVRIPNAIYRLD